MKYILFFLLGWHGLQGQTMRVAFQPEWVTILGQPTLYYELYVKYKITKVEVLNATNAALVHAVDVPPGDSIIYIELTNNTSAPLIHRINGVKGALLEKLSINSLVLGPPLGEGNWAAIFHPSWERGHRRVVYTVNDSARIPGRYAIDFVLMDDKGRYVKGDENDYTKWYGYGAPVLAVADAVVAEVVDSFAGPSPVSSGNYIALQLGKDRYAFYEHLKPGSIKVKAGDRVQKGQAIAALGFTGQATGPHLHFHVANRLSALGAEGIPFAFEQFTLVGWYKDLGQFGKEKYWQPNSSMPFDRRNEHPAPNYVIKFK